MFCKRVAVAPWIGYSKACTTGAQCEAAPAAILAGTVPSPLLHPASKELFSVWLSKGTKIWCAGTAWWSVVSCCICCSQITSPYSLLPCTFCTVYSLAFPSLACTVFFSVPFPLKFQICYCLHQSYPVILLFYLTAFEIVTTWLFPAAHWDGGTCLLLYIGTAVCGWGEFSVIGSKSDIASGAQTGGGKKKKNRVDLYV